MAILTNETGIFVPNSTRQDPIYISRQLLDVVLEAFPTEKQIAQNRAQWERMAIPQFNLPGMPDWVSNLFGSAQETVRASLHLTYSWRPLSREAMLQAMLANPVITNWLSSRDAAHWMWELGDPKGNPDPIVELNDEFYTHNEDGTLNCIDADAIVNLFKGSKETWPAQIFLTANHARTCGTKDISDIMRNVTAKFRHALPEDIFELERHPDKVEQAAGKSIVLCAVHSEGTTLRDGADLMYSNIFLRENSSLDKRVSPNSDPDAKIENIPVPYYLSAASSEQQSAAQLVEWDHRGPPRAAILLGKLILKTMAEDTSIVDVKEKRTFRDLDSDGVSIAEPIVLREDAAEIADRFFNSGFSKAASTVNYAARWVAAELHSRNRNGDAIFAQHTNEHGIKPIETDEDVAKIVSKIGILGTNGPGVLLTEEEKRLGMHRLRINNKSDVISGHFIRTDKSDVFRDEHDVICMVDGTARGLGHHQDDALGTRAAPGYFHTNPEAMTLVCQRLYPKFGLEAPTIDGWRARLVNGHASENHMQR